MKKSLPALAFVALAAFVQFTARAEGALDITKLNKVINVLAQQVLSDARQTPNSPFQALSLSLDQNGTDLTSEDRVALKLNADVTLSHSFWSAKPTTVKLELGGSADRKAQLAEADVKGTFQTDVKALTQSLVDLVKKDFCETTGRGSDPWDKDGAYEKKFCEEFSSLSPVQDLASLAVKMVAVWDLAKDYNNHKIAMLEQAVQTETGTTRSYDEANLKNARGDEKIIESLSTAWNEALKNSQNGVFTLKVSAFDVAGYGELKDVELTASEGELSVKLHFTSQKLTNIDEYFKMKPEALQYLQKLQDGDASAQKDIRETAKFYLEFLQGMLEG